MLFTLLERSCIVLEVELTATSKAVGDDTSTPPAESTEPVATTLGELRKPVPDECDVACWTVATDEETELDLAGL